MFTGLSGEYEGNYGPPEGFNFDIFSPQERIQADPALGDYNLPAWVPACRATRYRRARITSSVSLLMCTYMRGA